MRFVMIAAAATLCCWLRPHRPSLPRAFPPVPQAKSRRGGSHRLSAGDKKHKTAKTKKKEKVEYMRAAPMK